jgi:hypothetical protein
VDCLVEAFHSSGEFQVLHTVDLTTVAVAPKTKANETRSDVNRVVTRMSDWISQDTSADAYLVNLDRGLSGVKVRDSNRPGALNTSDEDRLVDIYCLRIVATNPAVESADASRLASYLHEVLARVRE